MEQTIQQLFDLTGQVALVTGATGHLGSAMARALAEAGATVVVSSRDRARAEVEANALPELKQGRHHAVELDYKNPQSIERGFADAIDSARKVDIVVNNGHFVLGEDWASVTADQFNQQLANQTGYFILARSLRNHVVERNAPGSIVMIGSMYGMVGSYPDLYEGIGPASPVAYHALKGGIVHMTRHLAVFWARDNVRVNCLSPGPFLNTVAVPEELVQRYSDKSPMKRVGRPEELKAATVFLAGNASSYMTGQNLVVDGGWTAW